VPKNVRSDGATWFNLVHRRQWELVKWWWFIGGVDER
jgi:hypothetical protein